MAPLSLRPSGVTSTPKQGKLRVAVIGRSQLKKPHALEFAGQGVSQGEILHRTGQSQIEQAASAHDVIALAGRSV
ncbi:MAG: hypothetical protein NTNFB02_35900 [Nitrospira sp.]